ncbi:MAG: hypothetical protein N2038_08225 [Geminicoccaceae bacterium]|nr:hypothetical protein [Geminicoccaceae bacterium]MCS7268692.1 hypothetical protein [Geminicoccaceae bacterium]MCX7630223.1 hypothetical protein [Geminicoccaceae bacterium]MDW8125836.1 hypothetical protein [Geminicoccaceae bacterium]MDW8341499.1 hypothetical protein [Geminicoccaceae bacterium]
MRGGWLVIAVLLLLLAASGVVALRLWRELEGVSIGPEGWLALIGGVAVTSILGVGLMALVFFSHRRGFDDRVGRE